jgi:RNA polymerase sigma factor (TIGR02999 family)
MCPKCMDHLPKDVTTLLVEWSGGNREALDELVPLVYNELHRMAARELSRENPSHTLQSTDLVHEAYLKLVDQTRMQWLGRKHFFAVASHLIRRILVDHARAREAAKRGGGVPRLALDESIALAGGKDLDLVALDDALETLARMDPQQSKIIEMRFFGGISIEDTAAVLGVSVATVNRDWKLARIWLHRELSRTSSHGC